MELLGRLRSEFPHTRLFVSTSTLAGRATAGQKLHGLTDGVFYAPLDTVCAVRRVLRTLRPSVVVVAETEIWSTCAQHPRLSCQQKVSNIAGLIMQEKSF